MKILILEVLDKFKLAEAKDQSVESGAPPVPDSLPAESKVSEQVRKISTIKSNRSLSEN